MGSGYRMFGVGSRRLYIQEALKQRVGCWHINNKGNDCFPSFQWVPRKVAQRQFGFPSAQSDRKRNAIANLRFPPNLYSVSVGHVVAHSSLVKEAEVHKSDGKTVTQSICTCPLHVGLRTPVTRGEQHRKLIVESNITLLQLQRQRPLLDDSVLTLDSELVPGCKLCETKASAIAGFCQYWDIQQIVGAPQTYSLNRDSWSRT
jgi:hypothetical protein